MELKWMEDKTTFTADGKEEKYVLCRYMYGSKKGNYGAYVFGTRGERLAHGVTLSKAQAVCQEREDAKETEEVVSQDTEPKTETEDKAGAKVTRKIKSSDKK